jgi:hypothetical protein
VSRLLRPLPGHVFGNENRRMNHLSIVSWYPSHRLWMCRQKKKLAS